MKSLNVKIKGEGLKKYVSIFILLLMYTPPVYCSITIPVSLQSCKYVMTIPNGWDTIPQEVLKQKLKQFPVEMAIYPTQQKDYFDGNYVLIGFLPTMNTLNEYPFGKIVENMTNMIRNGISSYADTLQVTYKGIDSKIENENYHIISSFTIVKDSITLECVQDLFLTKFGYISMMSYRKEDGSYTLPEISELLSGSILVQQEYKYIEQASKRGFTGRQIIFSVCIGLFVYAILMFLLKKKNVKR